MPRGDKSSYMEKHKPALGSSMPSQAVKCGIPIPNWRKRSRGQDRASTVAQKDAGPCNG